MADSLITDEHRALIGKKADPVTSSEAIEWGALRRFVQAIMDEDPIYWNEDVAKNTRYQGVVTPPLFPAFTNRRKPGTPDPLDRFKDDPEWDGASPPPVGSGIPREPEPGALPPVILPLVRLLNGGVSAEFLAYAKPGDRITAQRQYVSIEERAGRDGSPMVIVVTETEYRNQDNLVLAKVQNTLIRR